jgi:hypothetical protein
VEWKWDLSVSLLQPELVVPLVAAHLWQYDLQGE